jgi:hypothetical protein
VSSFLPAAGDPADRTDHGFFASRPAAPEAGSNPAPTPFVPTGSRTAAPVPKPPPAARPSRWAKSDVSFGPVGRILITLIMVVVGIWLAIFALFGAGLWWLLIMPWAMRDLWGPVFRRR